MVAVPDRYCVGPSMATDWRDQKPEAQPPFARPLLPIFPALLALALHWPVSRPRPAWRWFPPIVTKGLIDYLAHPRGGLEPLALIVGAGVGGGSAGAG